MKLNRGETNIGLLAIGLVIVLAVASYFLYIASDGGSNTYPRDNSSQTEKEVNFATLRKAEFSGHKTPATYVFYGENELRPIWELAFNEETLPNVDFSKDMVVAVFLGEQGSGGYGITITEVKETATEIYVTVQKTIPGPSCIVTQAITSPTHIVKLKLTDKTVTFISASQVSSCN